MALPLGTVDMLRYQDSLAYQKLDKTCHFHGEGVDLEHGEAWHQEVEVDQAAFHEVELGQGVFQGVGIVVESPEDTQRGAAEWLSPLLWWWRWAQLAFLQRVCFSSSQSR